MSSALGLGEDGPYEIPVTDCDWACPVSVEMLCPSLTRILPVLRGMIALGPRIGRFPVPFAGGMMAGVGRK